MRHPSEEVEKKRRRVLMAFAVTFAIWQSATIAGEWLPKESVGDWVNGIRALAGVAGLAFAWYALQMFQLINEIRSDPILEAALNDERVREARHRAGWVGLIAVVATLVAMRLAAMLWPWLRGQLLIDVVLLVAVLAPTMAFIFYDRE